MCGRYSYHKAVHEAIKALQVESTTPEEASNTPPCYNASPGTAVPTLLAGEGPTPVMKWLHWGWSKRAESNNHVASQMLINARAETAPQKRMFQHACHHRRCLLPADGFFEWKKSERGKSQPYFFHAHDRRSFFLAGIYRSGDQEDACVILTTEPNDAVKPIHRRMPVVLWFEQAQAWLTQNPLSENDWQRHTQSSAAALWKRHPVSKTVNYPEHTGPECIEPIPEANTAPQQIDLF